MNRNVKALAFGCGRMGRDIAGRAIDRGVEITGALEVYPPMVGKDLGVVLDRDPLGVILTDDAKKLVKTCEADIAIIATLTKISDVYDHIKLCLEHKINVITTSEDMSFAKRIDPVAAKELDEIAKANGVTVYASGIQDVFWATLPLALTGGCGSVNALRGYCLANIDNFGPAVAEEVMIGSTPEEYLAVMISGGDAPLDPFTLALYRLADHMGLDVTNEEHKFEAMVRDKDMFASSLNKNIPAGRLIGNIATSELSTKQGMILSASFISKLYEEGDMAYNKWEIEGEPELSIITPDMHGDIVTGTTMVNRIVDVINAPAGYASIASMPIPVFRRAPLSQFVK